VKSCPLFSLLDTRDSMVVSFGTNLLLLPLLLSWLPFLLRLFLPFDLPPVVVVVAGLGDGVVDVGTDVELIVQDQVELIFIYQLSSSESTTKRLNLRFFSLSISSLVL